MEPRRGRPPVEHPRRNILRIRLTDDELANLTEMAGDQAVAEFARADLTRKRRPRR